MRPAIISVRVLPGRTYFFRLYLIHKSAENLPFSQVFNATSVRHCCQKRQHCRKNRSTCIIRRCRFDVVAGVDRALPSGRYDMKTVVVAGLTLEQKRGTADDGVYNKGILCRIPSSSMMTSKLYRRRSRDPEFTVNEVVRQLAKAVRA